MINYLLNKYHEVKEYAATDVFNHVEVQAMFMQTIGAILVGVGAFQDSFGVPIIAGMIFFAGGFVIESVIILVDNALLKVYYMLNPEDGTEAGVEIKIMETAEELEQEEEEDKKDEDTDTGAK
jgi:hypothetical protein